MQLRCIRPFSQHKPGDLAEVPDGAAFDPFHFELAERRPPPSPSQDPEPAPEAAAAASSAQFPLPAPKEM